MSARNYLDFDLQIDALENGTFRVRVLNSPVGQAETIFGFPFESQELQIFFLRVSRPRRGVRRINSPEMEEVRQFGRKLYDALFQGNLETCLLRSIDQAEQQGNGLRLRLRLPPSLIEMPWEFLYDSSRDRFLVHSVSTPIVRYLELSQTVRPLTVNGPLKMLVMVSSPQEFDQLDVDAEWQKINNALAELKAKRLIELVRLPQATLAALQKQLRRDQYHIFHFIGHGGFDERSNEGVLMLEDENGRSRQVSGNYLGTLLHDHPSLRFAMLNACEGGRAEQSDPFAGVAQQLLRQGIPAVIAMQFEITDRAAITLSKEFYSALADGYPVDGALAEARKSIFIEGNDIEWGTPVLYLRTEDGWLFDVAKQPAAEQKQPDPTVIDESPKLETKETTKGTPRRLQLVSLLLPILVVIALWLWQPWSRWGNLPTTPSATSEQPTINTPTKETTDTLDVSSELITTNAISRTILLQQGDAAINANNFEGSKAIYEKLLAANPDDIDALLGLAATYRYLNQTADALQTLDRAAKIDPNNA